MNSIHEYHACETGNPRETHPLSSELASALLASGKDLRVRVTGDSMTPALKDGDIATIRKVPPAMLKTGDVVLCTRDNGTMALHRLLRIQNNGTGGDNNILHTKGDALDMMDLPLDAAQCLGRVVSVERPGHKGLISIDMLSLRSIILNRFRAQYYRFKSLIVKYLAVLKRLRVR